MLIAIIDREIISRRARKVIDIVAINSPIVNLKMTALLIVFVSAVYFHLQIIYHLHVLCNVYNPTILLGFVPSVKKVFKENVLFLGCRWYDR